MTDELDIADPKWLPLEISLERSASALPNAPLPPWSEVVRIPFPVIDAALAAYLRTGFYRAQPEPITQGYTRYSLRHQNPDISAGPIGTIEIRMLDDQVTLFSVSSPPQPAPRTAPPRSMLTTPPLFDTDEEKDQWLASSTKFIPAHRAQQYQAQFEEWMASTHYKEAEAHYRWRVLYNLYALEEIISLLNYEQSQVWGIKQTQLPPLAQPEPSNLLILPHLQSKGDASKASSSNVNISQLEYDTIISQAKARAIEKGLSANDPPEQLTGSIEIAEWFFAFWYPRGKTLDEYAKKFTKVGKRTIETYLKDYRATHNIPDLRELDKLRQGKDAE